MHLTHKVFPEWNQEKDAQDAAQKRRKGHFHKIDLEIRIEEITGGVGLALENIYGREGEYCTGNDCSRASSDRLDNDVLRQRVFFSKGSGNAYGYYCYRNCSLKDLSYFQSEVCCGGREYYDHKESHQY